MKGIAIEYFLNLVDIDRNLKKFHSYISEDNKQDACDSHARMCYL